MANDCRERAADSAAIERASVTDIYLLELLFISLFSLYCADNTKRRFNSFSENIHNMLAIHIIVHCTRSGMFYIQMQAMDMRWSTRTSDVATKTIIGKIAQPI